MPTAVKLSPAQRHALEAVRDRRVLYFGDGRYATLGYHARKVRSNVAVRLIHEDLAKLAPDGRELQLTREGQQALASALENLDTSRDQFEAAVGDSRR